MKQIVFISGKGGTGKSTLVSSLSILVQDKMLADCDVDAPNLHILVKGKLLQKEDYFGAKEAIIDSSLCVKCGICKETCRFDAISDKFEIIPMKCKAVVHVTGMSTGGNTPGRVKTGETYVSALQEEPFLMHSLILVLKAQVSLLQR